MPEKQNDTEAIKRAMSLMYSDMEEKYKSMENRFTDSEAKMSDRTYLDPILKSIKDHENKMAKLGRITKEAYRRSLNRGAPAASNLMIKSGLARFYPTAIIDFVGATVTPISATEVQVSLGSSPTTPLTGSSLTTTGPNQLGGETTLESVVLTAYTSPDLPTGGSIGSAATTVDIRNAFLVNQTTAGQTISLPNPTDTAEIKPFFVTNSGTQAFTIFGISLSPGESIFAIWDGDSYNPMKVGATAVNITSFDGGTSTGAGTNTYAITAPNKTGGLIAGDQFNFVTDAVGIAGAATLNVNGLGAIQILKSDTSAPDMTLISAGYNLVVIYNGTDFFIVNYPASSTPTATYTRENFTGFTGTAIALAGTPSFGVQVYKNGVLLTETVDYTIAGQNITLVTPAILSDNYSVTFWVGTLSTYFRENQTGITGTAITIATPVTGTVELYKNGVLLTPVVDYTLAGQNITLVVASIITDKFSIINL